MKQREYDIVIRPDGSVEIEVKGFKGRGCADAAKLFEGIIGEQQSEQRTQDYYAPDEDVRIHQGRTT